MAKSPGEVFFGGHGSGPEVRADGRGVVLQGRVAGDPRESLVTPAARKLLGDLKVVLDASSIGLMGLAPSHISRAAGAGSKKGEASLANRLALLLTREDGIARVDTLLRTLGAGRPAAATGQIVVRFRAVRTPAHVWKVLAGYGLVPALQLPFAKEAWATRVSRDDTQSLEAKAARLRAHDDVVAAYAVLVQERDTRSPVGIQWHQGPAMVGGSWVPDAHAGVVRAWELTRGAGATLAVIDEEIDDAHPDLVRGAGLVSPVDVTRALFLRPRLGILGLRSTSRAPASEGALAHGTRCAGIAAATGVGGRMVGVAPEANLMPIRCAAPLGALAESFAIYWAAWKGADVISCSWGAPDNVGLEHPMPLHTQWAVKYAVVHGRGGRGCVICFAAGNGGENFHQGVQESMDLDGYAASPHVMAVGASTPAGQRDLMSEPGSKLWCVFPSTNSRDWATWLLTTDPVGARGSNPAPSPDGDYQGFSAGMTSYACAGAAGVAALVLSVRPDLTWGQVRYVMAKSCRPIDGTNLTYVQGRCREVGHGRLDAYGAVKRAQQLS